MNTEKRIRIHDLEWTVEFVTQKDPRMGDETEEYLGLTFFSSCRILIRRDLPEALLKRTVRHELTHAMLFSCGFEGSTMNEEQICSFVETHAQAILELSEWLLSETGSAQKKSECRNLHQMS